MMVYMLGQRPKQQHAARIGFKIAVIVVGLIAWALFLAYPAWFLHIEPANPKICSLDCERK